MSKHVTKFNLEPCQEDTEALQEHIRKVFLDRSIQGVIVQQHDSSLSSSYKDSIEGKLRGEICVYFRFVIFANGTVGMTLYNDIIQRAHPFSCGSYHKNNGRVVSQKC